MRSLLKLLDAEYHAINSHNLGVQSGTAIIENLLVRRLHALCAKVHLLMVLHDDCGDAMAAFCAALRSTQLNRIQVCAPLLVPATVLLCYKFMLFLLVVTQVRPLGPQGLDAEQL